MNKHFFTKPDCSNRLPEEARVYDLLNELNIEFEGIDHSPAASIEDCIAVDKELTVSMCKNLFLRNQQKTVFYLLMMPGDKRFVTKDFSKQLEISRLSFAESDFMREYLDVAPGSVSVLGLMNDKGKKINLVIDEDLLENEYIGCHPCANTSSLKIKTSDIIETFLKHTGHSFRTVGL